MTIYVFNTSFGVVCFYFMLQLEWLTGGDCVASMHDLVVSNKTIEAINAAQEQKRCLWRVSSTVREEKKMFIFYTRKKERSKMDFCQVILTDNICMSHVVVCAHCIRLSFEATGTFCTIPTSKQISTYQCRRVCGARACSYQCQGEEMRTFLM